MKSFIIFLISLFFSASLFSQDCKDYWNQCGVTPSGVNYYSLIPESCFSNLLATDESFEVPIELIQSRDYKMSLGSTFDYKVHVKLLDKTTGALVYDNTLNDTVQVFEFQMFDNRNVRAIVSLPHEHGKKVLGGLTEKPKRYCVGIKIESMITRK
jgi:hypothetical protein